MSAGERTETRKPYALLVGTGIFLSRVSGLVRERAISHFMGASPAAGAFKAALRIPNFLQNLFGEGVLSASFIPVYARLVAQEDHETAGKVAGTIASILALFMAGCVAVGSLASPMLVSLLAPGFEGETRELTIRLARILFPGVGLLVLSAWCLGILNSHRRFFLSYAAPVLWNLAMIVTLLVWGGRLDLDSLAVALSWGMVAGSAIQFGIQLPLVLSLVRELRFEIAGRLGEVREVIRNFVPVVFGRGVVQVSAFVDGIIVSFLGPSTFAVLSFAQTIYLLPISLFGMSIAASELPQMSGELGSEKEIRRKLRGRLDAGLQRIAFLIAPTVVALLLFGDLLVAALYQTGRFGGGETRFVWYVVSVMALGLPAFTASRLYSSTFYALRDTRTPVKFAMARVGVAGVIGFLLAIVFRDAFVGLITRLPLFDADAADSTRSLGVLGVALGSALGGWLEWTLLRSSIARRVGASEGGVGPIMRIWLSALFAGVVAVFLRPLAGWVRDLPLLPLSLHYIAAAAALSLVFGVIYVSIAMVMGVAPIAALNRRPR